jgi:Ca2+-binding RTX toxin-like protein
MATINGDNSPNLLIGTPFNDVIRGFGGADVLNGGIGGGLGNDVLRGGSGNDLLDGGFGNDLLDGGTGNDTMNGGLGNDVYRVNSLRDAIIELPFFGTDRIEASISFSLTANLGVLNVENLTLTGTANLNGNGNLLDNVIVGNNARNFIRGVEGHDTLRGNGGNDNLNGDGGNDRLEGGSADDILGGGSGRDTLIGDAGVDRLAGGTERDTLTGGAGRDTFLFNTSFLTGDFETVTDFSHADDTMNLSRSHFGNLVAGVLSADAFHVGLVSADADDRIIYNNITGDLFFDPDGDGILPQTKFATLSNRPADVTASDFLVVG